MLNHLGTQLIETKDLILRRFEFSDCEAMLKNWIADEKVQAMYFEPAYKTKEAVDELLSKYINAYESSDCYRWAIVLKKSGECIGQIAYFLVDSKNNFAEIEYCIGAAFQNNGFATQAAKAVIKYGFEKIKLHKVQICHTSKNPRSKRVIEKCALKLDGVLRDYFFVNGDYQDRLYYSILANEYEKS